MTSPNRTRACKPGGCCGYLSFLSVLEEGEKENGGEGERGRRRWEKTRGASFDALNVQIYVEGQWSTFIRSFFLPPSHPAHWTSPPPPQSTPISPYHTPASPHRLSPFFLSSSFSPTLSLTIIRPLPPPSLVCLATPPPLFVRVRALLVLLLLRWWRRLWRRWGQRLLWTVAITPIGGIGRPQKGTALCKRAGWYPSNI